ncbi:MAG: hypothetical protein HOL85_16840 [Rhodospirillaceae bacterium]|nr:hypothetical protein [Rhodospirillaceae bacterium]
MTAPHDVTIRTNRAIFLLINGNLAAGWQEFRWRHGKPEVALERLGLPVEWTGAALEQGTLLVWQEQGIGDEVLFVSCVRDVARQSKAPVIVECEPRLRALFARSFPEAEFIDKLKRTADTPARVDFSDLVEARGISAHCGIGELALFARSKLETFPKKPGYLIPSPQKRAHWRAELDALGPETKIGLCWRSSLRSSEIDHYFVSIEGMAPILKLPGARFVNLQYDDCEAELAHAEAALGVEIIRPQGINLRNDLDDVAALISELDLVISTSTSVLAMSGAIGVPAIGLFLKRDWTFLGQPSQPWYPSVTPVIKGANRTWAETIEVAAEITREHL